MFNYGLFAGAFLLVPKVAMMVSEHRERKKLMEQVDVRTNES
jgi:hypothetical protein